MGAVSEVDLSAVLERFGAERENLIPLLQEVQAAQGYISREALYAISAHLGLSPNDVYGVSTFYTQFRFEAPGRHTIEMCRGTACHVRGGEALVDAVRRRLGIDPGERTSDGQWSFRTVACFGACALAPAVVVDGTVHGRMTAKKVEKLIEDLSNDAGN